MGKTETPIISSLLKSNSDKNVNLRKNRRTVSGQENC